MSTLSGPRTRWLLTVLAIVIATSGALSFTPGWLMPLRSPTQRETVLYFFAQNIGEPALCEQISWAAHNRYSVLFGGGGASYWRSDCYERVAQARKDESICWQVRPLLDFDPLSAGYSALSCWRRTQRGYHSGIALPAEQLVRTFEQLGYDLEQMRLPGVVSPAMRLRDVYLGLEHDASALARAQQLLRQQTPSISADDQSYLAHLAAIASGEARWCQYIATGVTLNSTKVPFRDWCYFTVAVNSQDVRICERMTPEGREAKVLAAEAAGVRPEIAEQMGLRSECLRIPKRVGPRPHYGPQVPPEEQQLRRLIATLGVVPPSIRDRAPADIAVFYQQFVFALWPKNVPDPELDSARSELVRRLLLLPGP